MGKTNGTEESEKMGQKKVKGWMSEKKGEMVDETEERRIVDETKESEKDECDRRKWK